MYYNLFLVAGKAANFQSVYKDWMPRVRSAFRFFFDFICIYSENE